MRMQTNSIHAGFTLIEVLFALAIISLVMFSYSKSLATASNHSLHANHIFFANVLLKNAYAEDHNKKRVLTKTTEIEFAGNSWLLERNKVELNSSTLVFIRYQAFIQNAPQKKAISMSIGRGDSRL